MVRDLLSQRDILKILVSAAEEMMLDGMLDSVKGCLKEEMRMDIISNNLANSTVIGFKKNRISFQSQLNQANAALNQNRIGVTGSADGDSLLIETDMAQGDFRITGNPMDFAISGDGFFKVMTPDGIRYTRKGNFTLDNEGFLATQQGYKVLGKGGPINLSGNSIDVDAQGVITVDESETGQLDVVAFQNPADLIKEGKSLFKRHEKQLEIGVPSETKVLQGYTELSNVNVAAEMVQMIHCIRAFESYQKAIQVIDGINRQAINEVSRLR
ncbi:flagellar basal-body rod protein FlgF [Thermodesulfobacteriota bacterium]